MNQALCGKKMALSCGTHLVIPNSTFGWPITRQDLFHPATSIAELNLHNHGVKKMNILELIGNNKQSIKLLHIETNKLH